MKRDVTGFTSRDKALVALANDFNRDKPLSLTSIAEVQESLSPEELKASTDTIAVMQMRSLVQEGKPLQAYKILNTALKVNPLNLALHLELFYCLNAVAERFRALVAEDVNNPLIDMYFETLFKEAYLNCEVQLQYLSYLVAQGRFKEASQMAIPLVALFPALLGLRNLVEQIAAHVPDPSLHEFVRNNPVKLGRPTIYRDRSPNEILSLKQKYGKLQEQAHSPTPEPWVARTFNEVLGEITELTPIDIGVKDIYYLKAIHEGNMGNHWAAIQLMQSLVEIDPCNLFYRRGLDIETRRFCDQKDLRVDARKAYAVLREFVAVPFVMIKQTALAEIREGKIDEAKQWMATLLSLNPIDNDYLMAALEVAVESKDDKWVDEIIQRINNVLKERPWDLMLLSVGQREALET